VILHNKVEILPLRRPFSHPSLKLRASAQGFGLGLPLRVRMTPKSMHRVRLSPPYFLFFKKFSILFLCCQVFFEEGILPLRRSFADPSLTLRMSSGLWLRALA